VRHSTAGIRWLVVVAALAVAGAICSSAVAQEVVALRSRTDEAKTSARAKKSTSVKVASAGGSTHKPKRAHHLRRSHRVKNKTARVTATSTLAQIQTTPPPATPAAAAPFPPRVAPLGYAGRSRFSSATRRDQDFIPIEDRWRIGFPDWDRYPRSKPGEYPYQKGHWWDPYNLNVYKGDFPIVGQHTFLDLTGVSDTLYEFRRLPTPSGQSTLHPGSQVFFGGGDQHFVVQNFILSVDLFHGDAGFKPLDWEFKFTPVFNINYLDTQERGVVNINPDEGDKRTDGHVGIQELFAEYKIADVSPYYDVVSVRAGVQGFTSDFRGFIYSDNEPGVLLFGNYESNRDQWNLAYFRQLEKDSNSGLNVVFAGRDQNVIVANFTRQDFLFDGYNAQLDFDYNNDQPSVKYDDDGFLVRPALIGTVRPHAINAAYFGVTGEGHIGRINVTDAFYEVYGRDSFSQIAGHAVTIDAQMGALELSYERDWLTYKASFFYASGDGDPKSRRATGFDSIFDNPDFAGSQFSFFNRQGINLSSTGVNLVNRHSLVTDLRSSKEQGQANFVNPGLLLYNAGLDAKVTPKLRASLNVNFLQLDRTKVLELLLHQNDIRHNLGVDYSVGFTYRPLLIDNIICTAAFAVFQPLGGFRDIYTAKTLFSSFMALTLVY
jgi:hypothetical protein